jgi:hypothetical protein
MKNLLTFSLLFVLVFSVACSFEPVAEEDIQIGVTTIDKEMFPPSDEWMTVPFEELPFAAEIPSWWSFNETAPEYTLVFDDGLTGYIAFDKEPGGEVPELADVIPGDGLTSYCSGLDCVLLVDESEETYKFTISDKGLNEKQLAEVWEIVGRLRVD